MTKELKPQMDTDGRRIGRFAARLLALMAAVAPCVADIPSGWNTNLAVAFKAAETNHQPVLLYFTASWCGPCKIMQANTLLAPTVRSNLSRFACIALDLDANQVSAQKHNVSGIPAFLVLTAGGDEVLRTEGYRDAEPFNAWLDKAMAAFAEAQEKIAAFAKARERIATHLKSTDAAERQAALTDLFNLCADREPSHQTFATAQFKALAARDPKALLAGLEHPKLAARIAAANELRAMLGGKFVFDVWGSPAERAKAVIALENASVWSDTRPNTEAERKE